MASHFWRVLTVMVTLLGIANTAIWNNRMQRTFLKNIADKDEKDIEEAVNSLDKDQLIALANFLNNPHPPNRIRRQEISEGEISDTDTQTLITAMKSLIGAIDKQIKDSEHQNEKLSSQNRKRRGGFRERLSRLKFGTQLDKDHPFESDNIINIIDRRKQSDSKQRKQYVNGEQQQIEAAAVTRDESEDQFIPEQDMGGRLRSVFASLFPFAQLPPGTVVTYCVFSLTILVFLTSFLLQVMENALADFNFFAVLLIVFLIILIVFCFVIILFHQQSNENLQYRMPLVPLLPTLSIIINAVLMTSLHPLTWVRLVAWVIVGFVVYFAYGIRHSKVGAEGAGVTLLHQPTARPSWGAMDKEVHSSQDYSDADNQPLYPS